MQIRKTIYFFSALVSLTVASCDRGHWEDSFFSGELHLVNDVDEIELPTLSPNIAKSTISSPDDSRVFGQYVISHHGRSEGTYSVSNMPDGSLVGLFCPVGRGENEPMDGYGMDLVVKDGKTRAWFYSPHGRKAFLWDVTSSIESGRTVYERVCPINYSLDDYLSMPTAIFQLDDDRVILQNPRQDGRKDWLSDTPRLDICSLSLGEIISSIEPFVIADKKHEFGKWLLNFNGCISPDRSKIALVMNYFPVLGIVDLTTEQTSFFKLVVKRRVPKDASILFFDWICCDDQNIYAMYFGQSVTDGSLEGPHHSILYVFDWEGRIRGKFGMEGNIVGLVPGDPGEFYLTDASEMTMRKVTASELEPFLR